MWPIPYLHVFHMNLMSKWLLILTVNRAGNPGTGVGFRRADPLSFSPRKWGDALGSGKNTIELLQQVNWKIWGTVGFFLLLESA